MPAPPDDFRTARRRRRRHGILQVLLGLSLLLLVNHLSRLAPLRLDLTATGRFTLAAETTAVLHALPRPVRITVSVSDEDVGDEVAQAARDLRALLREFAEASTSPAATGAAVRAEFVDVLRDRRRADLLGVSEPDMIRVAATGPDGAVFLERTVFLDELYATEGRQRTAFQGERVLASAILEVSGERRPVIYFAAGHGEMRLTDIDDRRGLSQLRDNLRERSFDLRELDLTRIPAVPDDASLVILAGPTVPFSGSEQEALRRYLTDRAGCLLAFLDFNTRHGLDDLLLEWGILVDDALAIDPEDRAMSERGDLLVRTFADHPVTAPLADNQIPVFIGAARPVREDPGRAPDDGLLVHPLLRTSPRGWGERDWQRAATEGIAAGPADVPGPVDLAMLAQRSAASTAGVGIPGGRLIVFGTSDVVSNQKIAAYGNLTLFLNAVNWLIGRDRQLAVPPRPVARILIPLSRERTQQLRLHLLGTVPGLAALAGLFVHLLRRH